MKKKVTMHFCWVPSHIGIWGNSQADALASMLQEPRKDIGSIYGIDTKGIKYKKLTISPSIRSYNKIYKENLRKDWSDHLLSHYTIYHEFNPDLLPPKLKHLPRYLQILIYKFRTNSFRNCPWHCKTICLHCEVPYSNNHYLWHCSFPEPDIRAIDSYLPSDSQLTDDQKTALILSLEDQNSYAHLQKVFKDTPPYVGCSIPTHVYGNYKPWEVRPNNTSDNTSSP